MGVRSEKCHRRLSGRQDKFVPVRPISNLGQRFGEARAKAIHICVRVAKIEIVGVGRLDRTN